MINVIWLFLVGSGLLYSIFLGNGSNLTEEILSSLNSGIELLFSMAPMLILWMGLMQLAKESGLLDKFGRIIKPFLVKLFPSLKKNSLAIDFVASNIACNMLGMGSAATPFGLKAMALMQEENEDKTTASEAMITFLVLNTAGVTIIPTTVIALRSAYGSVDATRIILPSIIATSISSFCGLLMDYFIRKKNR